MSWKIEGLKKFDSIFGRLACSASKLLVTPRSVKSSESPKMLVIRPGGIGDAVLLFPAIRELRKSYPESEINVLAEKRNAGIFALCPDASSVILYDDKPPSGLVSAIKGKYDIVIDTEQWHRLTAAVSYMTRAPVRAGFQTNERAKLYSHKAQYGQGDYEAVSFLNLASVITGEKYDFNPDEPFVPVDISNSGELDSALAEFKEGRKALVGIFSGATVNERRWGVQNFGELCKLLSDEGIGVVLLGGKADLESSSEIKSMAGEDNLIDFTAKTSLAETAYIISQMDLLISGDSGLMHIAYGVGTPTLSLFGAGIEDKWAPRGKRHIAINKNLPCSPCTKFGYTPSCPINVKCLSDITVEKVFQTAKKHLNSIRVLL